MPKVQTNQGLVDFPDDMTPEQITKALADNGMAPEGLLQKAGRVYKEGREAVIESLPDPGYGVGPALKGAAGMVLPETLGQVAGEAALAIPTGGLGKAASAAGRLGNVALRALGGAGVTTGTDIATGEPTEQALTRGAMTGGGALVGGAAGEGARLIQQNIRRAPQRAADTAATIAATKDVLPAGSGTELYDMVWGKPGKDAAGAIQDAAIDRLKQALPEAGQRLESVKELKAIALLDEKANRPRAPGSRKFAAAHEENVLRDVAKIDPDAVQQYSAAMANYRKFMAAREFLQQPGGFNRGATPEDVTIDFRTLQDALEKKVPNTKTPWRTWLQERDLDGLVKAVERGGEPGVRDELYKMSVGSAFASAGPVGVRTPMQGIPLPGVTVPAGRGAIRQRDPRIDTLLGGILGRMTGQSAGFGGR